MKPILGGTLLVISFKSIGVLLGLATQLIISRNFGADSLGVYNLILTTLMITAIAGQAGLDLHIVRMVPKLAAERLSRFATTTLTALCLSSLTAALLLAFATPWLNSEILKSRDYGPLLVALPFVSVIFTFSMAAPEYFRGLNYIAGYAFLKNCATHTAHFLILAGALFLGIQQLDVAFIPLIGIPLLILAYVWVLVRAIMALVRASNREPMPNPSTLLA